MRLLIMKNHIAPFKGYYSGPLLCSTWKGVKVNMKLVGVDPGEPAQCQRKPTPEWGANH